MGKQNKGNTKMQHKPQSHQSQLTKSVPIKKSKPQTKKGTTSHPSNKSLFKTALKSDGPDKFAALGYGSQNEQVDIQQQNQADIEGDIQHDHEDQEEIQFNHQENHDENALQEEQGMFNEQQQVDEDLEQNEQGYNQDFDYNAAPLEEQDKQPAETSLISLQIQQTINIISNVNKLGKGKPKKYYIEKLKELLHQQYGYNFELIDHFLSFLNPNQVYQLFQANLTPNPVTIRTNTLKTKRKELAQHLIQRGVNLDPFNELSKVGIKIYESKIPICATPEYLAGHYILQSASSFLPVLALDPQPEQRILDMSAAPGGKTTYIAQLMKNTGCIFANDLNKQRLKALRNNLNRMGVTNAVVTCRDGRKYSNIFPASFDKVLLDAPSTGLGIISKDPAIKTNVFSNDIVKYSLAQKDLLLAAIDCTKVGGIIVYSTCSLSPLQNEQVVNFALKKRFVKIAEIETEFGQAGLTEFCEQRYHEDLSKTRRIYPHVHSMDGFYVAKLMKVKKGKRKQEGVAKGDENN